MGRCRGESNPQRFHSVFDDDRRHAVVQNVLCEVPQLERVGALEALHEVGNRVVRDIVLGHRVERGLAEVTHS